MLLFKKSNGGGFFMKRLILVWSLWMGVIGLAGLVWAGNLERFALPVSNPIYNHDARNYTMVRAIFLHHNLPDKVEFRSDIKRVLKKHGLYDAARELDGDVQGMALAFSIALNERFSIIAIKDGYVDCDPGSDSLIGDGSGLADIAGGVQYALIYDPDRDFILSLRGTYEIPAGEDDVYQGNGDGNFNLAALFMKGFGNWQFSGSVGFILPMDNDEEDTLFYDAWHLGYNVTPWLHPFVELNHFYVIDSGDRDLDDVDTLKNLGITNAQGLDQAITNLGADAVVGVIKDILHSSEKDDLVAALASFSGCDIVNLGGSHSDENRSLVTMALGVRLKPLKWLSIGAAYEFSLTDDEESLIDSRYLVDAVVTFNF